MSEKTIRVHRVKTIGDVKYRAYPIDKIDFAFTASTMFAISFDIDVCPICGEALSKEESCPIRVSDLDCIYVQGNACINCDSFYSDDILDKEELLWKYHNKVINKTFNKPFATNYLREVKDCESDFEYFESAFVQFYLLPLESDGMIRVLSIVNDESDADDEDDEFEEFVMFSSETATKLLQVKQAKRTFVVLENHLYRIVKTLEKKPADFESLPEESTEESDEKFKRINEFNRKQREAVKRIDTTPNHLLSDRWKQYSQEVEEAKQKTSEPEPEDQFEAEEQFETDNQLEQEEWDEPEEEYSELKLPDFEVLYIYDGERPCGFSHKVVSVQLTVIANSKKYVFDAEYCPTCDKYMLSRDELKRYVKLYHSFPVKTRPFSSTEESNESERYSGYNEQSKLRMLGYTVSSAEDLPAWKRREILQYAIESGIMTRSEIQRFLTSLIEERKNRPNMENAIEKWKDDLNYIENYYFYS